MATPVKLVQTPATALYTGLSAAGTTMRITPYPVDLDGTKLAMSDFGTTGYCTVDPKVSGYEEIISFTGILDNGDNTATLSGLTRNLLSKYPYTTPGTGKIHGASAVVVFSDSPQVYASFPTKANDETITGVWVFPGDPSRPGIAVDADTTVATAFVTFGQLSRQAIAGAANASTTVKGLAEEATQAEIDAATAAGGTSARLFVNPSTLRTSGYGAKVFERYGDYAADAGSNDTYAITLSPAPTAYTTGMLIQFKPNTRNTGACTLNVNSLGAKSLKIGGNDPADGDLDTGYTYLVMYDGTNLQVLNPKAQTPTGSMQIWGTGTAPNGFLLCDGSAVSRTTYASLFAVISTTFGTGDGSTTFNLPDFKSRSPIGAGAGTFATTFANTDVNAGTDIITVPSNVSLYTGAAVVLTGTGTAPTGLTHSTTYYVIRQSATTIKLATSYANAIDGTAIDITGQGTGVNTLTITLTNNSLATKGGEETHGIVIAEMPSHNHTGTFGTNTGASSSYISYLGNTATTTANVPAQGGSGAHNNLSPFLTVNFIIKT